MSQRVRWCSRGFEQLSDRRNRADPPCAGELLLSGKLGLDVPPGADLQSPADPAEVFVRSRCRVPTADDATARDARMLRLQGKLRLTKKFVIDDRLCNISFAFFSHSYRFLISVQG